MTHIYGIKNCDTMKKAMDWLEAHQVEFEFHDYKKKGVNEAIIANAIKQCGWERVINRAGTTWRKLPDETKAGMDEKGAIKLALENPSVIKRPLLVHGNVIYLGFNPLQYAEIFEI